MGIISWGALINRMPVIYEDKDKSVLEANQKWALPKNFKHVKRRQSQYGPHIAEN